MENFDDIVIDNFSNFFDDTIEYIKEDFNVDNRIEEKEIRLELKMFEKLPNKHKKLYNDLLICELFGDKGK